MTTFDDMMKKLQQDDPEAYAESIKMQEQARAEKVHLSLKLMRT